MNTGQQSKILKLAVIGVGWVTQQIWLPAFISSNNAKLVAIYDPFAKCSVENILLKYPSVKICHSLSDLIKLFPDLVLIATPNKFHTEYANLLLQNNINVLVEKPVCLSVAEYQLLSERLTQTTAKLIPSGASKFRQDVTCLQNLLKNNHYGEITSMELEWIRSSGIPGAGSWFTNKELAGGGVGYDLGWHMLDIGLSLIDYPDIQSASAIFSDDFLRNSDNYTAKWKSSKDCDLLIEVEDTMRGNINTCNNVHITINLAWASHSKVDYTKVKVNCEHASIDLLTTFGLSPNRVSQPQIVVNKKGQEELTTFEDLVVGVEYNDYAQYVCKIINNNLDTDAGFKNIYPITKSLELMYEFS